MKMYTDNVHFTDEEQERKGEKMYIFDKYYFIII